MNAQTHTTFPAEAQRRKAESSQRSLSLACAQNRSLGLSTLRPGFAPMRGPHRGSPDGVTGRLCGKLLLIFWVVTLAAITTPAQEVADTIRIQTRVVFLDALVKDRRTSVPISDLKPENFEVYDDGKPRAISYFTREGQARRPLALVLILDLRDDGAGRFLKRAEVIKSMMDELAKLPPEDEVAIVAMNVNGTDERRVWLSDFSRDRSQLAAALARVPAFVDVPPEVAAERAAKEKEKEKDKTQRGSASVTVSSDSDQKKAEDPAKDKPKTEDVVETETIKGKNGAVVTRTIKKDGAVSVKRVSSDGRKTVEIDDIYDMAAAVRDATRHAEEQRPNSQASIVWVSDGIAPIFFEDRDATEKILIRSNVIFNSLTVDLRTLFKVVLPIAKPIGNWMGMSLYGSAKQLAQQSGGEAVRVNRPQDYGAGLGKIIGNLTARYSLGFSLAELEKDDGRMHQLEVRVKAPDEKGKTRKLIVSARQGYYMPSPTDKDTTAVRAQ
jgi:VWFA-related protein